MKETAYAYYRRLPDVPYEQAVRRTSEALKSEGFGVLTTIDVREVLKQKLGAEFKRYVILGACNPQLAHKALTTDDCIGVLLPCNVVVAEANGGTEVCIQRPDAMFRVADNPELRPIAAEAEQRLVRALERI